MKDKVVTRCYGGLEVRRKVRVTLEITMSQDWAECIAHQAEGALEEASHYEGDSDPGPRQELKDLISAIDEALR